MQQRSIDLDQPMSGSDVKALYACKTRSISGAVSPVHLTGDLCQGRPRVKARQGPQELSEVKDTHIDLRHTDGLKQQLKKKRIV